MAIIVSAGFQDILMQFAAPQKKKFRRSLAHLLYLLYLLYLLIYYLLASRYSNEEDDRDVERILKCDLFFLFLTGRKRGKEGGQRI